MKLILHSLFLILVLLGGMAFFQSADTRISQPTRTRPRPIPPPCCQPFRAEDFSVIFDTATLPSETPRINANTSTNTSTTKSTSNSVDVPITELFPASGKVDTKEAEAYRKELEVYRLLTEQLRKAELISNKEYALRLSFYKLRMTEYKETVKP